MNTRVLFGLITSATLLVAASLSLVADPGDTHTAYTTLKSDSFPGYSTVTFFADAISGSATGTGYQSSAYRFKAGYSGPLEKILVALYAPGGAGADPSVRVSLHSDAGNSLGAEIRGFDLEDLVVGRYKGYFAYNNYGSVGPDETTVFLAKGKYYWLMIEPLRADSLVYWALSELDTKVVRRRDSGGGVEYKDDATPDLMIIDVFEPTPPLVRNPAKALVEGAQIPDQPDGAVLSSLGAVPQSPCLATITRDGKKTSALLDADGKVQLELGDPAPFTRETQIIKIGEPSGNVVLATLKKQGAVNASNDAVLIGGLKEGSHRIVARTGEAVVGAGGAVIKKFLAIDGGGNSTFFLAQLAGTGVSGKNDSALCAAVADEPAHVLVREGDAFSGALVKIIGTLVGYSGSSGEGRWRADGDHLGVRLTLDDKRNVLVTIPGDATTQAEWTTWVSSGFPLAEPLAGAVIKSIGAPGFGPGGVIFPAVLQSGVGGVIGSNDGVLLQQTSDGLTVIGREGAEAPDGGGELMEGVSFKSFGNPVYGPTGKAAFMAATSAKGNNTGIWWLDGVGPLRLIARAGDPAPTFGTFSKFTNLVLPNAPGSVPIFQATLASQPAAGVTGSSSSGIWALNNAGSLVLVARDGGYVYLSGSLYGTMSKMSALVSASGSTGAAHGVDETGALRINATIANRAEPGSKRAQFTVPIPQP